MEQKMSSLKTPNRAVWFVTLVSSLAYLLVSICFVVTQLQLFLFLMEVITIVVAPIVLLFIISTLTQADEKKKLWKQAAIAFATCCAILTATAHFINLAVTMPLIRQGVAVPDYFQIGKWPSVEMAVDYLAWGFFLGMSLLSTAISLPMISKNDKRIRSAFAICGCLCIAGMLGPISGNELFWLSAVIGYGLGLPILSMLLIRSHKC